MRLSSKRSWSSLPADDCKDDSNYHIAPFKRSKFVDNRTPMNKVFDNDLLREKIIGHFINSEDATPKNICSAKLVHKSWLWDVNRQLRKSNQPFFHLKLDEENSLNESDDVRVDGKKMLDRFTSTMKGSIAPIAPFHLTIGQNFFRAENHTSLSDFFQSEACASGLVSLDIYVPANGGTMTLDFPEDVDFPALKKLNVIFCMEDLLEDASNVVDNEGSSSCFVPFLQFILDRAEGLRELTFKSETSELVPTGIEHLELPSSLTKLYFHCALNENQLQMLVTNSFPNLVDLSVQISEVLMPDCLLFQILDNVKSTLRRLILDKLDYNSVFPGEVKYLRFPVMSRLEVCEIYSFYVELDTQTLPFQTCLPELKRLILGNHTVQALQKWTENEYFPKVTTVCLNCYKPVNAHSGSFNTKHIEGVHRAFPNLENFMFLGPKITVKATRYIFKEMKRLQCLSIGLNAPNLENSDHWDSLFIGAPIEEVQKLRPHPELWEHADFTEAEDFPSIKNLTALRELHLYSLNDLSHFLPVTSRPLMSDLAFYHAFHKMPNLKRIELTGRFVLSTEMAARLNIQKSIRGGMDVSSCLL